MVSPVSGRRFLVFVALFVKGLLDFFLRPRPGWLIAFPGAFGWLPKGRGF